MGNNETGRVVVERILPAAPAEVFAAWLDRGTLREFIGPGDAMLAPSDLAVHQPGAFEHLDVLRHRVERHGEGCRQVRDARPAGGELPEDRAARRIRERQERVVETGLVEGPHEPLFNQLVDIVNARA